MSSSCLNRNHSSLPSLSPRRKVSPRCGTRKSSGPIINFRDREKNRHDDGKHILVRHANANTMMGMSLQAQIASKRCVRLSASNQGNETTAQDIDDDDASLQRARDVETNAGRAAMLGFVACTVFDAMTNGDGPILQLSLEESWAVAHIDPLTFVKDVLEVGEVYIETLTLLWVWVLCVFVLGLGSGLVRATPVVDVDDDDSAANPQSPSLGDAYAAAVTQAQNNTDAELLNGRLAMIGMTFVAFGEEITGQGPLEQLSLETGVPVIGVEGFAFAFGLSMLYTSTTAVASTFRQTLSGDDGRVDL